MEYKQWEARSPERNDTGEWAVQEANLNQGDTGQVICDVCPSDQAEANARLIALAPEMLEVLKGVRDWCNDIDNEFHTAAMQILDELESKS